METRLLETHPRGVHLMLTALMGKTAEHLMQDHARPPGQVCEWDRSQAGIRWRAHLHLQAHREGA